MRNATACGTAGAGTSALSRIERDIELVQIPDHQASTRDEKQRVAGCALHDSDVENIVAD
jgi:hypothetical protein